MDKMFSGWFNPNSNQKQKQKEIQFMADEIIKAINAKLTDEIGQEVPKQIANSLKTQLFANRRLQDQLIALQNKHHNTVQKVTQLQQNIKRISNSIVNFINAINEHLQSDQLLIPLRQIQKGFNQFSAEKVDKHVNLLIKLYNDSFEDIIKKQIKAKEKELLDEMQIVKNLNKNLQVEVVALRNVKLQYEKRNSEINMKMIDLMDRNEELEKIAVDIKRDNDTKEKYQKRQLQYTEVIKELQRDKVKLNQKLSEAMSQITKSGTIVQKIKNKQQEVIEQLQKEMKKKQNIYQQTIRKITHEKKRLQSQIDSLKQDLAVQRSQNVRLEQAVFEKEQTTKSLTENEQQTKKIQKLLQENQELKSDLDKLVNKQIIRELFLSYEDQSKQWSIRNNIKNQMYLLLGVQKKQTEDTSNGKKWFGFF